MREKVALLVNNLHFLSIIEYAERHYGTSISSRTFTALDNHKRASEVIFYCLFKLYDPDACKARLSALFPCTDGKMAKEFRNALFKWLTELKKSSTVLGSSTVRRSLLDDCAGERYEDLLFHLSSHIYLNQIRTTKGTGYAECTFDSSLRAICHVDTSVQELMVHDLVHTYRLRKLRRERTHQLGLYKDFSRLLRLEEQELAVSQGRKRLSLDTTDALNSVERQLARLHKAAPGSQCLTLFSPAPVQAKSFFTNLPWQQAPRTSGNQENFVSKRDLHAEANEARISLKDLRHKIHGLPLLPPQHNDCTRRRKDQEGHAHAQVVPDPEMPQIVFRRKTYNDFEQDLHSRLEKLEPGYAPPRIHHDVAMVHDNDGHETHMTLLRQLTSSTSAAPVVPSLLPRRMKTRELKPLNDTLQKTLLKSRVQPVVWPDMADDDDEEATTSLLPCTPRQSAPQNEVSSTIKTIHRLIHVLNDSDASMSSPIKSEPTYSSSQHVNRRLESSFSLWATHDD